MVKSRESFRARQLLDEHLCHVPRTTKGERKEKTGQAQPVPSYDADFVPASSSRKATIVPICQEGTVRQENVKSGVRGRNSRRSPDRASIHEGRIDCNTEHGEIETQAPLSGLPTRASSLPF